MPIRKEFRKINTGTKMVQPDKDKDGLSRELQEFIAGEAIAVGSSTSYLALKGGDIIQFDYNGTPRFGIVIGTSRKPTGKVYLSSKGNQLFSLALLQDLSPGQKEIVINILHGNRFACRYHNKPQFEALFGSDSFRRFKVSSASSSFLKLTKSK